MLVDATVMKAFKEVESCSVSLVELQVHRLFVESEVVVEKLPFSVEEAQRPEAQDEDESSTSVSLYHFD